MARAKRTDRANARRRYRAQLLAEAEQAESPAEVEAAPPPRRFGLSRPRTDAPAKVVPAAPPLRRGPGIFGAMRGAYRPLDFRGDLSYWKPLVLRSYAVWPASLLTIAANVFLAAGLAGTGNSLVYMYWQLLGVLPYSPQIAGPFVAGLLAPRAGWLAGLIVAFIGWVTYVPAILTTPLFSETVTSDNRLALALTPLLWVPFGGLVGGFAAWYKRFLSMTTPARTNAKAGSRSAKASRPAPRRR